MLEEVARRDPEDRAGAEVTAALGDADVILVNTCGFIDAARQEKGMSEREMSALAGKSPGMYWWFKKKAATTSFQNVLTYCNALGLKIEIAP